MEIIDRRLKLRRDRSGLCGGQMCSLFLLITRPRNFEWGNLIGGLVKCGAQHFVDITQYWCQGWLVHRRIYWLHQHKAPIQAINVFFLCAKFRGRVGSSNSERIWSPYSRDLSRLVLRMWSMISNQVY